MIEEILEKVQNLTLMRVEAHESLDVIAFQLFLLTKMELAKMELENDLQSELHGYCILWNESFNQYGVFPEY